MLKKAVSKAAAEESPGGVPVLTHPPRAAKTALSQVGTLRRLSSENAAWEKRVSARWGWAGDKGDFFSILLRAMRVLRQELRNPRNHLIEPLSSLEIREE